MFETTNSSDKPVYALAWNEKKRKHFVFTCGTTLPGEPGKRPRYKVATDEAGIEYSMPSILEIPQPKVLATYFSVCGSIDQHNFYRQALLALEEIWITHRWECRLWSTILGMNIVDAYLARMFFNPNANGESLMEFVDALAMEMFETEEGIGERVRNKNVAVDVEDADLVLDTHTLASLSELDYYKEAKQQWLSVDGKNKKGRRFKREAQDFRAKRQCVCGALSRTTWYCIECSDTTKDPPVQKLF